MLFAWFAERLPSRPYELFRFFGEGDGSAVIKGRRHVVRARGESPGRYLYVDKSTRWVGGCGVGTERTKANGRGVLHHEPR